MQDRRKACARPVRILWIAWVLAACSQPPPFQASPDAADAGPGLKDRYRDHFLVGSMVQDADIEHPSRVVERHCSIVTSNHFYWRTV